jgi:hypothetical protein
MWFNILKIQQVLPKEVEVEEQEEITFGDDIDKDKCCRESKELFGEVWAKEMNKEFPDYKDGPFRTNAFADMDCDKFREKLNEFIEADENAPDYRWGSKKGKEWNKRVIAGKEKPYLYPEGMTTKRPKWNPLAIAARKALDEWEDCEGWKESLREQE